MSINFNTGIRDNPIKNGTAFKDNNNKKKHAFVFLFHLKLHFYFSTRAV